MRIERGIERDDLSAKVDVVYGMTSGPRTIERFEFYEGFCGETPGEYVCKKVMICTGLTGRFRH